MKKIIALVVGFIVAGSAIGWYVANTYDTDHTWIYHMPLQRTEKTEVVAVEEFKIVAANIGWQASSLDSFFEKEYEVIILAPSGQELAALGIKRGGEMVTASEKMAPVGEIIKGIYLQENKIVIFFSPDWFVIGSIGLVIWGISSLGCLLIIFCFSTIGKWIRKSKKITVVPIVAV